MQNEHVPMVSVCIQTYNHAAFIAQCLDSVLEQETDFNYEIILGEDDSNDGTRTICQDYQQKHPGKIRLFLRSKEDKIFIDGVQTGRFNFMENIRAASGKYIALLDGDDYWIDPLKLQKQVEQMEADPSLVVSCGKIMYLLPGGKLQKREKRKNTSQTVFELRDAILHNFYPMSTLFFHNSKPFTFPSFIQFTYFGDLSLVLWLAKNGGKIGFIDQFLSVYRVHIGSITNTTNQEVYFNNFYKTLQAFDEETEMKYSNLIARKKFITEFELNCLYKPWGFRIRYYLNHFFHFIYNYRYINNQLKVTLRYLLPINTLLKIMKKSN